MTKDIQIPPFKSTRSFTVAEFQQRVDWGVKALGIEDIWQQTAGANAMVFVMDTGIDKYHSDLQCNLVYGVNFTGGPLDNWQDQHGHGTHVAGIVAACANEWGIVGVAPGCPLFACKVLADDGSGSSEWIVKAIEFVIAYETEERKIINLSLGSMVYNAALEKAVNKAWENNIPIIAAAGNDGDRIGSIAFPAAFKKTFAVASYNKWGKISDYSQSGVGIDFAAPGEDIFSTTPGESYATYSGTSMATPFVAGVVALMLSLQPDLTVEQVRKKLSEVAVDMGEIGYDSKSGWGLIQPAKSIEIIEEVEPVGPDNLFTKKEVVQMVYEHKASFWRLRKWELKELARILELEYDPKLNRRKLRAFIWGYLQAS